MKKKYLTTFRTLIWTEREYQAVSKLLQTTPPEQLSKTQVKALNKFKKAKATL